MGFLPPPCPLHPTVWCKGSEVASHCSPGFCSLSAPVTAKEWSSGLPPLPPGQAAVPPNLTPHCLFSTCLFSLVTPPGLIQHDPEATMSSSVLAPWENCTPALRTGLPQPRRKVGCQHQIRQRLPHHPGSPEARVAQGERGILTFDLIPTVKFTRTNISPQNVSFLWKQYFLMWELLYQWLFFFFFSTVSNSEQNLMRFCSSTTSSARQAQRESFTTDSSDAMQNISAQQGFRSSSGNKWLYCLYFLSWQTPSQQATLFC